MIIMKVQYILYEGNSLKIMFIEVQYVMKVCEDTQVFLGGKDSGVLGPGHDAA